MSSFLVLKEGKVGATRENLPPKQPLFGLSHNIPLLQTAIHILNKKKTQLGLAKTRKEYGFGVSSLLWGGMLGDDPNNSCIGDQVKIQ